jgi:hypothetical protein
MEFLTPPEIAAMLGLPKRKRERAGAVTAAVFRFLVVWLRGIQGG